ncbi:MAG: acylphosphatase [Candidatus Thermoplasmatota archaeon]|jgi:acylphosphatase|nr:acylphosphatase [Candidatus Thermoplasmatota archaeon]
MKTSVHVLISGRVQGVWFRASTKEKAEELGLTGWVRNTPDGNVEAIFEGEEEVVKKMLTWCHHGPPMAKVEDVIVKKQKPIGFKEFSIRY